MNLMQLQRTMARAVMQPLTSSERMQRRAPDGGPMKRYASRFIKPNDRLTSFERLEIYNRQYWFRVLSALSEDFPGLRAVLGERRFDAMAKAYLIANPSRSFTLRNLSARMESWLRKNPKWAGTKQTLALDIVRLEWADIEAFDGKAEPALRPEDLERAAGISGRFVVPFTPWHVGAVDAIDVRVGPRFQARPDRAMGITENASAVAHENVLGVEGA